MTATFVRNDYNQLTFVGFVPDTADKQAADLAWRTDQLGIDIRRHFKDLSARADVRGFKEQQKFLRDKAWREGYVRPAGELRGFRPDTGRRGSGDTRTVRVAA